MASMRARWWIVLGCAALLQLGTPNFSGASGTDECGSVLTAVKETPAQAFDLLKSLFRPKALPAAGPRPPALYVTIGSGTALGPTCRDSDAARVETSLYYPIGLVVDVLGDESITDRGRSRAYKLVHAEHGLLLYVPAEHLAPISSDTAFVFADGPVPVSYCSGQRDCPITAPGTNGQVLHASQRYATAPLSALTGLDGNGCGRLEIAPHDRWGASTRGGASTRERAYVDTCLPDADGTPGRNGNIRIVTAESAKTRMAAAPTGSLQRYTPSLLKKIVPTAFTVKECNQKYTEETALTAGAALKVANWIEIEGGANHKRALETKLSEGCYYLYGNYTIRFPGSGNDEALDDIVFVANCVKDDPTKLEKGLSLLIYNDSFPDRLLSVDANDVLKEGYLASFGTAGLEPVRLTDNLRHGQFWRIRGSDQYFYWRTALRKYMLDNPQLEPIIRPLDETHAVAVADFFAHLVMAAAFQVK